MTEAKAEIRELLEIDPFALKTGSHEEAPISRKISHVGLITASAVVLGLINFPFPLAPFLQFDLGFIPVLIGTFKFGRNFGLLTLALFSILFELLFGRGIMVGPIMHIAAGACFIIPAAAIYQANKNRRRAMTALLAGTLTQTLAMIPLNWIVAHIAFPIGIKGVLPMDLSYYLLVIVPSFNLIMAAMNSFATFHIYKKLSPWLR